MPVHHGAADLYFQTIGSTLTAQLPHVAPDHVLVIPKGETTSPTLLNLVVGWPQLLEEKR